MTTKVFCWVLPGLAAVASCNVSGGSDGIDDETGDGDGAVDVPTAPDLWTTGCGVGVLASGLTSPMQLVLDGDRLLVTTTARDAYAVAPGLGNVYDVPLDGTGATELATGLGAFVSSIATDGVDLFVSLQGVGLRRVSLASGAVSAVPEVTDATAYVQVVDGTLYYNSFFGIGGADDMAIRALDLATGVVTEVVPSLLPSYDIQDFTTDGVDVFYHRYERVEGYPGALIRRNIASGAETVVASGAPFFGDLQIHNDRLLYVVVAGTNGKQVGMVHDRPLAGGAEQVMVGDDSAFFVTASDTSVYWSGSRGGDPIVSAIHRVGGGLFDQETIPIRSWDVPIIPCPGGICWTDADEGTVKRYVECAP